MTADQLCPFRSPGHGGPPTVPLDDRLARIEQLLESSARGRVPRECGQGSA